MNKPTINSVMTLGAAGVAVWLAMDSRSQAQSSLLPFQGRLTDATGIAVPDGAKVVEFKIYDAPTGGTVKWAGEVHKLSVNGGLVNTMLGSKASLGGVDFSAPRYLQITVDANGDDQITAADPPLLPRQSVVPAVYAVESGNSRKLNNADWSAILTGGSGDPVAGTLRGDKLAAGSVNTAQLAAGSVKAAQLDSNIVASAQIVDGTIQEVDLSPSLQMGMVPIGTVVAYAAKNVGAPPGWAYCNGASVLRADPLYAALFDVIGTNHGSANSSGALDATRFNLPDYRGRFLRGVAHGDGYSDRDPNRDDRYAMAPGGATQSGVGSLQDDAFQNITGSIETTYAVVRSSTNGGALVGSSFAGGSDRSSPSFPTSSPSGDIEFNASKSPGARTSSETRPKNAYVTYIIKL